MKNSKSKAKSVGPRTRARRRAVSLVPAVALALGLGLATGSAASAASTTPGDFSSLISPNVKTAVVNGCVIEVGHVFDKLSPTYSKIAGVRINCNRVHSRITATVVEQWYNPATGQLVNWGTPVTGYVANASGFGTGIKGILKSGRYCGAPRGYAWVAKATVTIDGAPAGLFFSNSAFDKSGC